MQIEKIYYTTKFAKNFKKLPQNLKLKTEKKVNLFRQNPKDTSLKTHKLSGALGSFFSFSVNYSYRIIFAFESSKEVTFIDIGDHSIYS